MAKRFIDTNIFKDDWFSNLDSDQKLFFIYYICSCDHAGILKFNKRLIEFEINCNDSKIMIESLSDRIIHIKNDIYWMPKFFTFQYPNFPEKQFASAISAFKSLKSNKIPIDIINSYLTLTEDLHKTYLSVAEVLPKTYGNGNGNGIIDSKQKKKPTIEDFKKYCKEKGYIEHVGETAWNYYENNNWEDKNGTPVVNWKNKLVNNWFKEIYKVQKGSKEIAR